MSSLLQELNSKSAKASSFALSYGNMLWVKLITESSITSTRQRGAVVWSIVFTTTMIARLMANSQPSLVVASLNKMLHDDYLCLVESIRYRTWSRVC